jgi:hypothetical protein
MKRVITFVRLLAVFLLFMAAGHVCATPYKNIHVTLEVAQTGAGTVYLEDCNNNTEHPEYHTVAPSGGENSSEEIADLQATFGEEKVNDVAHYYCILHAIPNSGYDVVGFALKNASGIYTDEDLIGTGNYLKVDVNVSDDRSNDTDYNTVHATGWPDTPDFEFVVIFKPLDTSTNNVAVGYYQPLFSGAQDDTFGTWNAELVEGGTKVKLTAIPADGMRFVCWRNAQGNEVCTDLNMTVDNVTSTFWADFDLSPCTLPAELSTYSHRKQSRFDNIDGLVAYKVTAVNNTLTLEEVRHADPGEGVILKGNAGSTYNMSYQGLFLNEDNSDNLLKGTAIGTVAANGNIYVLANGNHGIGFYRLAAGSEVPQGKAYLELPDGAARAFVGLGDDVSTSIAAVSLMPLSAPVFNMAGQRVNGAYKGFVIQNGRKMIRK